MHLLDQFSHVDKGSLSDALNSLVAFRPALFFLVTNTRVHIKGHEVVKDIVLLLHLFRVEINNNVFVILFSSRCLSCLDLSSSIGVRRFSICFDPLLIQLIKLFHKGFRGSVLFDLVVALCLTLVHFDITSGEVVSFVVINLNHDHLIVLIEVGYFLHLSFSRLLLLFSNLLLPLVLYRTSVLFAGFTTLASQLCPMFFFLQRKLFLRCIDLALKIEPCRAHTKDTCRSEGRNHNNCALIISTEELCS